MSDPTVRPQCVPCWIIACNQWTIALANAASQIHLTGRSPSPEWDKKIIHAMDHFKSVMEPLLDEAQGYTTTRPD